MRYLPSVFVLFLAFGLAMPPSALATNHRHHYHHKYGPKTKRSKKTVHHGNTVPTGQRAASKSAKHHRAMHKYAQSRHVADHRVVRRHGRLEPETEAKDVESTIPPIPMRDGRLYMPPPMRGSLASLTRQDERDRAEGLQRIQNTAQLNQMRREGKLVALPASLQLRVNPDLPLDRRCARPWTVKFLANLARAHFMRFDRAIQVNSAVRTVQFQRSLVRVNGNAAPATGDTASPHLMGATIDIGKHGMSLSEIAWMRAYLLPLQEEGKIDVEEEFYQACFHITVYESYAPRAIHHTRRRHSEALLATTIR